MSTGWFVIPRMAGFGEAGIDLQQRPNIKGKFWFC
jgi:hypothetical protein